MNEKNQHILIMKLIFIRLKKNVYDFIEKLIYVDTTSTLLLNIPNEK